MVGIGSPDDGEHDSIVDGNDSCGLPENCWKLQNPLATTGVSGQSVESTTMMTTMVTTLGLKL